MYALNSRFKIILKTVRKLRNIIGTKYFDNYISVPRSLSSSSNSDTSASPEISAGTGPGTCARSSTGSGFFGRFRWRTFLFFVMGEISLAAKSASSVVALRLRGSDMLGGIRTSILYSTFLQDIYVLLNQGFKFLDVIKQNILSSSCNWIPRIFNPSQSPLLWSPIKDK